MSRTRDTAWVPRDPHVGTGLKRCAGVRPDCGGSAGKRRVRRADGEIEHLCLSCAAAVLGCSESALGGTDYHYGDAGDTSDGGMGR